MVSMATVSLPGLAGIDSMWRGGRPPLNHSHPLALPQTLWCLTTPSMSWPPTSQVSWCGRQRKPGHDPRPRLERTPGQPQLVTDRGGIFRSWSPGNKLEAPSQTGIHSPELAAILEVMACINEQQDLPCLLVLLVFHLGPLGKVFAAWGKDGCIPQRASL